MGNTAISFKVPPRLWNAFKVQTDALFLSRAPFLNHMVKRELVHLRQELNGLTLTTRAKRHISGVLKRTEPQSVNIEVESETAEALRSAMSEHNLVRDAFMCRLIIFLRSTDKLLGILDVPRIVTSDGLGTFLEEMPASPLGAMEAVRDDPLLYIRSHVEASWECGIYRVPLPRSLDWAACFLEDEVVPGTRAYRKREELFELLDAPATERNNRTRQTKKVKR